MSHGHARGPGGLAGGMLKERKRTRPAKVLLGILWQYLSAFKISLVVISLVVLVYAIASTYAPMVISQAIDMLGTSPTEQSMLVLTLIFLAITFAIWIFDSLNLWIMAHVKTQLVHSLRVDTFDKLVDADMNYHHKNQSGEITQRVIGDTEEVANGLNVFTNASSQLLLIFVTFGVVFWIDWTMALVALLAIPVAFVIIGVMSTVGRKRMMKVRRSAGQVSAKLAEALSGVTISKSFNREEWTSSEIKKLNQEMYHNMNRLGFIFTMIMPSIQMVASLLVALVLLIGGYKSETLTIGTIYLGTVLVQRFLAPVIHLGSYFTQLQASFAALDRVVDVQEKEPAVKNLPGAKPLFLEDTSVEFDSVSFAYETNTQVLNQVSIKVASGAKIALVGHTGAGKTTITNLLMRFYDPNEGKVIIGGQDLREVTLESIHDSISLVSQEPYLFADTVLENIRYGRPDATDKEIYDLCKMIGADEFIEVLPEGYQTVLQESGKSLSAGQRQMITIARTWLSDPRILVLDEATSRLDAYSESLVQRAQQLLFKGRTTIVIAHRLSTIRDVNKIIVLENGVVVEQGSNEELLTKKGKYYELYKTYYAHQGVRSLDEVFANGSVPDSTLDPVIKTPQPPLTD